MTKICSVEKKIRSEGKDLILCDETRSELLPILRRVQDRKGYISDKDMQEIADRLGIHPVEVYSVVTFYSFLNYEKQGSTVIRVSNCISNLLAGSKKVLREFEKELKIKSGQTTKDKKITLKETSCIGMCDKAPAIMVNDKLVGNVTPKKVQQVIKGIRNGK
ncbi:MAG: NAD(P)H-dependent oxidoreductase subunit E [Candidatus Omnitrophica bacterium]|nr:NAD(P)H-dependent oxidoreductase subunit E [Candidatus Omnitrophota bacterium]